MARDFARPRDAGGFREGGDFAVLAAGGNDRAAVGMDEMDRMDGMDGMDRMDGMDGMDEMDGMDGMDGIGWGFVVG